MLIPGDRGLRNDTKPATACQASWVESDFVSILKEVLPSLSKYTVLSREDFLDVDVLRLLVDVRRDYLKARSHAIIVACQGGRTRSGCAVCYISSMLRLCMQIPEVFADFGRLQVVPRDLLLSQLREWTYAMSETDPVAPFHCPSTTRVAAHVAMGMRPGGNNYSFQSLMLLDRCFR
jgi:hypothetical protein